MSFAKKHNPGCSDSGNCCAGECINEPFNTGCSIFTTPNTVEVIIAGIQDNNCTDCTDMNGTYILERDHPGVPNPCFLRYQDDTFTGCGSDRLVVTGNFFLSTFTTIQFLVDMRAIANVGGLRVGVLWSVELSDIDGGDDELIDCADRLDGESLTFSAFSGVANECQGTPTCTVNVL